jgi:FkbM family methyltransferase
MLRKLFIKIFFKTGRFLCRFRGAWWADTLYLAAKDFCRSLDNVNFNFKSNGELRVLNALNVIHPKCVFDVGANKGEWSLLMASIFPACTIHAFEIVPSTFQQLKESTEDHPNILTNNIGLSDVAGKLTIHHSSRDSSTATACRIEGMKFHDEFYTHQVECEVMKIGDYIDQNNIGIIDLLKIDVEGMDFKVILGLGEKINSVRVIQFEYGIFNIASHHLLSDICAFLSNAGFIVGRILPEHVDFFEYHFYQETFHGGNCLAVRKDENDLINKLKK